MVKTQLVSPIYELKEDPNFNLFVKVIPFNITDALYYSSLNDDYPKPVWWQQPAIAQPRIQVNSIHICPRTGNEYMINGQGKRVVDTKVVPIRGGKE